MRGVRKPWQPKNVSIEGRPPRTMQQAESELLAGLDALGPGATAKARTDHARVSHFDNLDKSKLRKQLREEQHGLCVYCETSVPTTGGDDGPPIEHWQTLSRVPIMALHWDNLYLSCPRPGTCDDLKLNRRLRWDDGEHSLEADLPWPTQVDYEDCVGFTKDGRIYVRSDAQLSGTQARALRLAIEDQDDERGPRRDTILNLNSETLLAARKAAIDSEKSRLEKRFAGTTALRADRERRAKELLDAAERRSYVSARVAYLRRETGRGR